MPGFDGTGPRGKGPMTGWARGYCVLRESNDPSNHVQGFAGVQGIPVNIELPEAKEVTVMPLGNGVGPLFGRGFGCGRGWGRGRGRGRFGFSW